MEGPPPKHRIMDDRQVYRADEAVDGSNPPLAAPLSLSRAQSNVTQVEEEQDQHRGQTAVPFPPGSPGRTAPDRAGHEADRREGRPRWCSRPASHGGERMSPHQLANRGGSDARPSDHAKPGRGNV